MNGKRKVYAILSLAVIAVLFAALVITPTAYAYDGRTGNRVVIAKDEVINDDLYLGGDEVIVEGTINGDLMAAAERVVISGKVTGDLWVIGSEVIVNGEIGDDVFAAAAVVRLESNARVADDMFSAGAGVESSAGSQVGGSLMIGAFQGLVAGNVGEDLRSGTNRLRLEGQIGRDAMIYVDTASGDMPDYQPWRHGSDMPSMVELPVGLTFGSQAKVLGRLEYTSSLAISIPSTVAAQVQHLLPPADEQVKREINAGHMHLNGTTSVLLSGLRRLIALLLVTAVLAWLIPTVITRPAAKLQARPWPSIGSGLLALVATPFILFFLLGVIILVAILFGALTLGELVGGVLGLGLPGLALVTGGFFLMLGYLPQAMVAYLGGRWFFRKVRPEAAEKVFWPVMVGALVLGLLMAVPVLGGMIEFVAVIAGLGAIILLVWESLKKAPKTSVAVEAIAPPPAAE